MLLVSVGLWLAAFFINRSYPSPNKMLPELLLEPIQTDTTQEPFEFDYRGETYEVKPMAEYEMWGLIVSMNDINALTNYYHDKNTVNLQDICVVWGENISSGMYERMKFTSGEWTCYPKRKGTDAIDDFNGSHLGNNHLLASNEQVLKTIRSLNLGDQVHVKGQLVGYAKKGAPAGSFRNSSLSRDDTDCEVVFVNQIEILQKAHAEWQRVRMYSVYGIAGSIFLEIFFFFFVGDKKIFFRKSESKKNNE